MSPTRKFTVIVLLAGLAFGLYLYLHRNQVATDDAFVEQHVSYLAPRVAGQVLEVVATENQFVQAGDPVLRIDPAPLTLALNLKEAELERAQSAVKEARSALEQFREDLQARRKAADQAMIVEAAALAAEQAHVEQTRSELELAQRDANRFNQLAARKQVSQQQLDQARTRVTSLRALLASQQARIRVQEERVKQARIKREAVEARAAMLAVMQARLDAAQAAEKTAQNRVKLARLQLSDATVRAPRDGRITHLDARAGSQVTPARPVAILVSGEAWIEANFKETQLAHVHIGQRAIVELDRYPGQQLTGQVQSIQPGTGARFSVLPPENATGNFVKVTQRVPVRIALDTPLPEDIELLPGLSAHVTVVTADDPH